MRAITLARKSSNLQGEDTIAAQSSKTREYCQKKGFSLVEEDEHLLTESSTKGNRDKFNDIISEIRQSKEKIIFVIETIDRLQRSFKETIELDAIRKEGKLELHFLRENLIINEYSNSADLLRWDMGVMFARSYVLQLSDNVKRSIRQRFDEGRILNKAPIGYKNTTDQLTGKKSVKIDDERAEIIKHVFEDYATGNYSLAEIEKKYITILQGTQNKKPIKRNYFHTILQNPFYAGLQIYKHPAGKVEFKQHIYPPLISLELFKQCQYVMKKINSCHDTPIKYKSKPFAFRGLIKCACCGATMSVDIKKGKYYYIFCNNAKKGKCDNKEYVKQELVLEQISDILKEIKISDNVFEEIRKFLENRRNQNIKNRDAEVDKLRRDFNKKQLEIDNLTSSLTAAQSKKSMLAVNAIIDSIESKQKEKEEINYKLQSCNENDDKINLSIATVFKLAKEAHKLFEISNCDQKRQILNFVCSNFKMKEKHIDFIYKKPFDMISNGEFARVHSETRIRT